LRERKEARERKERLIATLKAYAKKTINAPLFER